MGTFRQWDLAGGTFDTHDHPALDLDHDYDQEHEQDVKTDFS